MKEPGLQPAQPYVRSGPAPGNAFSMSITATGAIFNAIDALSSNSANDTITIAMSGAPTAFGADLYGTDINGATLAAIGAWTEATITTSLGNTATLRGTASAPFGGFTVNGVGETITSVTLVSNQVSAPLAGQPVWPTADDTYVGKAVIAVTSLPTLNEFMTLLLTALIAAFGFVALKRRS